MRRSASTPFVTLGARSLAPIVLTCEHARAALPVRVRRDGAATQLLATHWGWDPGAWELTTELARRLRTTAVGGRWSRLWIDLNRRIGDPTSIRTRVGEVALPWNARLSPAAIERRVLAVHVPYHVEVDRLILRRVVRGVRPLLLALHSFTPELDGCPRPFDIGVLYDEHAVVARRLGRALAACGLSVRYNEPYSGMAGMMYAVERHGAHHRLPCLELEVNQARFARPSFAAWLASQVARQLRPLLAADARA